jgi:ABC-type transport system involved in cytochrome c biogenesis ATPase subunit
MRSWAITRRGAGRTADPAAAVRRDTTLRETAPPRSGRRDTAGPANRDAAGPANRDAAGPANRDTAAPANRDTARVAAVRLDRISRHYGPIPGISDVTLTVEPGEALLLRGANGSGKSTLLRVLATALAPTSGDGSIFGNGLTSGREAIRARTELIGDTTRFYLDLTAAENLRFWCRMNGVGRAGVAAALDRVGLLCLHNDPVRGFSRGMRQRLALARCYLRRPDLLLLDEPCSGLDADAAAIVDSLITEVAAHGGAVIAAYGTRPPSFRLTRTITLVNGAVAETARVRGPVFETARR